MADQPSEDRSADSTNEPIEALHESGGADSERLADEQTLTDCDQTLADADQTGSDSDQTAADSDQAASDSDQAASDRDLKQGGDVAEHDATRDLRDQNSEQRKHTADWRSETAAARDADADDRDLAALARDQAAALQDGELAARDAVWDSPSAQGTELTQRAAEDRKRAVADRAAATEGRARAAADRAQAALDRKQAANDRTRAQAEREALLSQVVVAETDALTGVRTRGPGLADVDKEIERARRGAGVLVIAYVDLVGLKAVNDTQGHAAGDALLKQATGTIRSQLRSYDLIVRVGGDEFICVISGATVEEARRRFEGVKTLLAADSSGCEIDVGFSALMPGDSTAQLIQRADAGLPARHR